MTWTPSSSKDRASGHAVRIHYVDLVYREDDGSLMIIDYKTDAVPPGAIPSRVIYYRPQMNAYREAMTAATGAAVSATLLFLSPHAATAVPMPSVAE